MPTSKDVNVLLNFILQRQNYQEIQKAIEQTQAGFGDIQAKLNNVNDLFDKLSEKAADALTGADLQKAIEQIEQWRHEVFEAVEGAEDLGQAVTIISTAAADVGEALASVGEKAKEGAEKATVSYTHMRESLSQIRSVALQVAAVGAAISLPLVAMARDYIRYAGQADDVSRRWASTMADIERSKRRVGRVVAAEIVPLLEKGAEFIGKIADFVEAHPELVKIALAVGGTLTLIGGLTAAVIQLAHAIITIQGVFGAGGMLSGVGRLLGGGGIRAGLGAAAGTIGTALSAAAAPAAVIGGGLALGGAGYEYLRREGVVEGASLGQFAATAAYGARTAYGGIKGEATEDTARAAQEAFLKFGELTGAIDKNAAASGRAAIAINEAAGKLEEGIISEGVVQAYISYRRQEKEATRQYEETRTRIVEQYAKQRVELEENYGRQRSKFIESFNRSVERSQENLAFQQARQARNFAINEAKIEAQYYEQRSKLAEKFGEAQEEMEKNHQRQLEQLREDHLYRLEDLVSSRDALGILREMRAYERTRDRAEENYDEQSSKQNENYADQISEMEQQFTKQRALRMTNYQRQLADQQIDFNRQQDRAKENFALQLTNMEENYKRQQTMMDEQEEERLQDLKENFDESKKLREQALADEYRMMAYELGLQSELYNSWWVSMTNGTLAFVNNIDNIMSSLPGWPPKTGNSIPGYSTGGYAPYGVYQLGEKGREFILDASTTRAAERLAPGGMLTQDTLMRLLSTSGLRGGVRGTLSQSFRFEGVLSAAERQRYRRIAKEETETGMRAALGAV